MRIIAGTFRGRQLVAARDRSIRPTTDRAKQAIFDVISTRMDFEGIEALDLFAGSGSLGLEALSRGAKNVTFVEKSRTSIAVLERNIRTLGCEAQTSIHQADVFWFLRNAYKAYDLVFADPPFRLDTIGELPSAISSSKAVRQGTIVVLEHSRVTGVRPDEKKFDVIRKQFGQTVALIMKVVEYHTAQGTTP